MAAARKKRTIIIGSFAASTYLLNTVSTNESDSDNENGVDEELVQHLINIDENVRVRGKIRKVVRVNDFVEYTIPRFTGKQFKEHFRISLEVFGNLENRLGNLLLRQATTGRSTVPVRKQLLATLWLLSTPDSYR